MPHATPTPDDRENTYRLLMDVFRAWRATVPDGPDAPELVRRFGVVAALAAADVLDDET